MGCHKASDHEARKRKYAAQFIRTEANKKKHIAKMKKDNPNWPNKKDKDKKEEE